MRALYILIAYLLTPVVVANLIWRGFRNRGYWRGLGERFGWLPEAPAGGAIWVHAVSVGEVQAAIPLVRALRERFGHLRILVTTVTPTGRARATAAFGDDVEQCYAPYDLPGVVKRFFDRKRLVAAIIMETELWPNLFHECGKRKVPLVLASARISPRSVKRYRRFLPLFRDALAHGIVIAAQSQRDADRFLSLGANPQRTHTVGNIKFDLQLLGDGKAPRDLLMPNNNARPAWIAASTHQGEEEIILKAQRAIVATLPDTLLVLAPRQPERFSAVVQRVTRSGLNFVRRGSGQPCLVDTQVFVLDTLGELPDFFRAVDAAFVGGSLVPVGGHNLLEPAAASIPVLTGPHYFNSPDIAEALIREDAAVVVHDDRELAERMLRFLQSESLRGQTGARARAVIDANRGTLLRILDLISPLIEARD